MSNANCFKNLFSELSSEEIAMYIIETGRANSKLGIKNLVEISQDWSAEKIITSSFEFGHSVAGATYWTEIVFRLRDNKNASE